MSRLPSNLRQKGEIALRKAADQDYSRARVAIRAGGRCEACTAQTKLDWHHNFKRNHIIEAKWADTPEMCAGVCRPCHNRIHSGRDSQLDERLQWEALARFVLAQRIHPSVLLEHTDPVDAARAVERLLKEREG